MGGKWEETQYVKISYRYRDIALSQFNTGQEIEDVHIFGGQTPGKRLENLNACAAIMNVSHKFWMIKLARSNLIIQNLWEKFIFVARI